MTPPGKNRPLENILSTSSAYRQNCTLQAGIRLKLFTAVPSGVHEISRHPFQGSNDSGIIYGLMGAKA